jgi:hypothetical protein
LNETKTNELFSCWTWMKETSNFLIQENKRWLVKFACANVSQRQICNRAIEKKNR